MAEITIKTRTFYRIWSISGGKSYIGSTTQKFGQRISSHFYRAKHGCSGPLYNDIRRYGENEFDWEVIYRVEDTGNFIDEEKSLIEKYNSIYPNGYNKSPFGVGFKGLSQSEESNLRQSSLKGKCVRCINRNKIYPSIKSASLETKVPRLYIREVCNGNTKLRYPRFWYQGWRFEWA